MCIYTPAYKPRQQEVQHDAEEEKRKMRGNSLTANARNSASECFENVCFLHSVRACSTLSSRPLEESPALQRMTKHSGNRALHVAVRTWTDYTNNITSLISSDGKHLRLGGNSGYAGHSASSKWNSYLSISLHHQSRCRRCNVPYL